MFANNTYCLQTFFPIMYCLQTIRIVCKQDIKFSSGVQHIRKQVEYRYRTARGTVWNRPKRVTKPRSVAVVGLWLWLWLALNPCFKISENSTVPHSNLQWNAQLAANDRTLELSVDEIPSIFFCLVDTVSKVIATSLLLEVSFWTRRDIRWRLGSDMERFHPR